MATREDWYYGIWFVDSPLHNKDWMVQLTRSDGKWHARYRFRYYAGDTIFDGADKKNWYAATMNDDSEESKQTAIRALDEAAQYVAQEFGGRVHFVKFECDSSDPAWAATLAAQPWAHVRSK